MLIMYRHETEGAWICTSEKEEQLIKSLKEEGTDLKEDYSRFEISGDVIQVAPRMPTIWGRDVRHTGKKRDKVQSR